ncbi:hypothetical protein HYDPIDRAFT_117867 [Hydnomerulius pinastri MD-312]|uniref:Uncharacterized protein n=1 Tax=Hydnomerulius pinastri MD-312 TaxID=994086 RepID=A0A0C9V3N7_9AGAM|nr:hypothetical protein HYDPIDRAFT_117867 [Hydnomerulius pinastri MD-312]
MYSIPLRAFRSMANMIDKHCDTIADQIKSQLPQIRSSTRASTSTSTNPNRFPTSTPTSPAKPPTKSALKTRASTRDLTTPSKTPSNKRGVAFPQHTLDNNNDDDAASFPATPTKKRRIDSLSPSKSRPSASPSKRSQQPAATSVAAFHAALAGEAVSNQNAQTGPQISGNVDWTTDASQNVGPSTPRRPRTRSSAPSATVATPMEIEQQSSPSRPAARAHRRFRPVYLEQQQWCARDPKVERMWALAVRHRSKMMELYEHPFERYRPARAVDVMAA